MAAKKRYPKYKRRPRPADHDAELDRSRRERAAEVRELGRSGMVAIRERIRTLRAAKRIACGHSFSYAALDRILPPVECRFTRVRLAGSEADGEKGA